MSSLPHGFPFYNFSWCVICSRFLSPLQAAEKLKHLTIIVVNKFTLERSLCEQGSLHFWSWIDSLPSGKAAGSCEVGRQQRFLGGLSEVLLSTTSHAFQTATGTLTSVFKRESRKWNQGNLKYSKLTVWLRSRHLFLSKHSSVCFKSLLDCQSSEKVEFAHFLIAVMERRIFDGLLFHCLMDVIELCPIPLITLLVLTHPALTTLLLREFDPDSWLLLLPFACFSCPQTLAYH